MSFTRFARLPSGVIAALAMAIAVGNASASTGMSVTNGVATASFGGPLTFQAGGLSFICDMTLALAINSSITKSPGTAGLASILPSSGGSAVSGCNLGMTGTVLRNGTIEYIAFVGNLPDIAAINGRSSNLAFALYIPLIGQECLSQGAMNLSFMRNAASGLVTSVAVSARNAILAPEPCPSPLSINGSLTASSGVPEIELI